MSLWAFGLLLAVAPKGDWPRTGNDPGGMRYSTLAQIDRTNVQQLQLAWEYKVGDAGSGNSTTIECTPIVVDGTMFVTTARGSVAALDPVNGQEKWRFTPGKSRYAIASPVSGGVNRGVAYGTFRKEKRVFLGTADGQLISLDAKTGRPDPAFGQGGIVELRDGLERPEIRDLGMTSPPIVFRDLVICGSTSTEGARPGAPGDIRAFDLRTGKERWRFRTVPRPGEYGHESWPAEGWQDRGGVNAWGGLTLDEKRGLVFAGTGSPAYDWFGGDRAGDNLFGNCTLALDAGSGRRIWHFQTVRHDLWDFDLPCPPVLVRVKHGGRWIDAAAQVTKTGYCFVFDRQSGKPLFGVEDRPVPGGAVPGESPAATQPFPLKPPALGLTKVTEADLTTRTPEAHADALRRFREYRSEGIFTPGGEPGTIGAPAWHGGATWSGAAYDPATGYLFVNINNTPMVLTIGKTGPNAPTPYGLQGTQKTPGRTDRFHNAFHFNDVDGYPAIKPPWGTLTAVDLNRGEIAWQVPLGGYPELTKAGGPLTGTESFGGAIVTAGGLVLIGGSMDERLHAYDKSTGKLLWEAKLPAGGYATPCTYMANGRQYVVIAAGGGGKLGTKSGDRFVAFALPKGAA